MTNIVETNTLFAEFMGWERGKYHNLPNKLHKIEDGEEMGIHIDQLEYHSSWDSVMGVWHKFRDESTVEYESRGILTNLIAQCAERLAYGNLPDFYRKLSDAIKWYNDNEIECK